MTIWQSEILTPLTRLTSKKKEFKWGPTEQHAFDTIKLAISKETLLTYPNFSKEFEIHTDASQYQLGAVIAQDNKPITFIVEN